jgi:hypothetical protein
MRRLTCLTALTVAFVLAAEPTVAGQAGAGIDLALPPPAESGKPATGEHFAPPLGEARECPPALPCGTRLLGTVRRNGAVELQVPAWRW